MHRTYHIVIVDASRCNVRKVENKIHVLEWIFYLNRSFTTIFRSNGSDFCTKENAVFSLKNLFLVHRKQNLKTLPKITQIKEISAWVSHFPRHTLIPVQNDSILSSLTGSTLPISSKYQNGLKLFMILPPFWILMNGISVDKDYIFFGYIIPTFKNSINNISNANIFFH